MTKHLWLDLNLTEGFAVVNPNDASNHFRHSDHVPQMGPDRFWLLTRWGLASLFCSKPPKNPVDISVYSKYNHTSKPIIDEFIASKS